jgi:hypothetical protein
VDIVDGSGLVGQGFDATTSPFDAWNMDLPYWFNVSPSPSLARNESVLINDTSPGTGWVQGELVFSTTGPDVDWYAWYLANDSAYAFPDFEYIRASDVATLASSLGIPFKLVRLFSTWELYQFTPDRQGYGVRLVTSPGPSTLWSRSEVRLIPETTTPAFVMFAGTGDQWAPNGLVRVSDWPAFPGTQGSDNATIQSANSDPMHGYDRSTSGNPVEFPFGFYPATGTPAPGWSNGGPFEGESPHISWESYDDTPTPPSGWSAPTHRLAAYPVPITEWGASDLEGHAAPSVDPHNIRLSDMTVPATASTLWSQCGGVGAWGGEGAFAVHLLQAGITKT